MLKWSSKPLQATCSQHYEAVYLSRYLYGPACPGGIQLSPYVNSIAGEMLIFKCDWQHAAGLHNKLRNSDDGSASRRTSRCVARLVIEGVSNFPMYTHYVLM